MSQPNLDWTAIVAERKIQEAIEAGEFDDLPGKGKPIELESDAFTPPGQRIVNRILKNARALPEWLQLEKDIERESGQVAPSRERGLRALAHSRSEATRQRIAVRLRADYRERIDLINTLILKYNYIAPNAAQRPFVNYNLKREMAALEADIEAALKTDPFVARKP